MSFVIFFDLMVDFVVADGGGFEPDAYEAQCKTFGLATSTAAAEKLARMWHEPSQTVPTSTSSTLLFSWYTSTSSLVLKKNLPPNTSWVCKWPSLYEKNGFEVIANQAILMENIY